MQRTIVVGCAICMIGATACFGSDGETRQVLVDYSHDEFASFSLANFPSEVTVAQGTKLVFKQTWTGEPHTVTGGTLVNDMADEVLPLIEEYADVPEAEIPEEAWVALEAALEGLPWAIDETEGLSLNRTAAEPCYIDEGRLPMDGEPCENREQPGTFTGEETYYNSGIIPYEGPRGNTFEVRLAEDIEPGTYTFYCAVHGPDQRTQVQVVSAGSEVPSTVEVNRQARRETEILMGPLEEIWEDAQDGVVSIEGLTIEGPFAGLWPPAVYGSVNEFIPRTMEVGADEPITWKLLGFHSISFDVPEYFPIAEFADDGSVELNPKLAPPAGGAPDPGGLLGPPEEGGDEGPPEPIAIDGGTYDGEGFWSSGLMSGEPYIEYTLRISEPGTYSYACLIHPPMVGTVVVT